MKKGESKRIQKTLGRIKEKRKKMGEKKLLGLKKIKIARKDEKKQEKSAYKNH